MQVQDYQQSRVLTNCLFVLTDVLENLSIDVNEQLKRDKLELKHECKRHFNTAFRQIGMLRKEINKCSLSTQISYGDDADVLYNLVMVLFDRIGSNNDIANEIIEDVKKRPSQLHLEL